MARHHFADARVQALVGRLTSLTLELGSVNAVAEALSSGSDAAQIYPNRLHGLLAGDPSRSINTATLEAIERRLAAEDVATRDTEREDAGRARIAQAVAAESVAGGDLDEAVARVAERLSLPLGLVRHVAGPGREKPPLWLASKSKHQAPDWSWQDVAVERSLRALAKTARSKAGLVVPTGGGKTRIALTVALRWLSVRQDGGEVVLWVTHRRHLQTQARRVLQELLSDHCRPVEGAAELFASRIKFTMVQDLASAVVQHGANTGLVIVDEAHHAAAASYGPIFDELAAPALFLTATPNRSDEQPIGIDEICYTITYRELFERGCLIEPTFEPPLDLPGLDWSEPGGLDDLADYLLDRAETDFRKALVVVALQSRAESLYRALADLLATRTDHVLTPDNVGFVHGSRTSGPANPSDFLDEFAAWPRGILVATSQLIGEGFDAPTIDAVVVTYPSTSICHLMQVAGRALRTTAGKESAHIVQVRESPLEYHYEQRWLYQDISDALRPALIDLTYMSAAQRQRQVEHMLSTHRVAMSVTDRILIELTKVGFGEKVNIVLTGLPYWQDRATFDAEATWGALLVTDAIRPQFLEVFNGISCRTDDLKESESFLQRWIRRELFPGSSWRSYVDLVHAMEYARREIVGIEYAGANSRSYSKPLGTTWLRYATFTFAPAVPAELDTFLADVVNRVAVLAAYEANPAGWELAAKIELPLTGFFAYLLCADQAQWFRDTRDGLVDALALVDPLSSRDTLEGLCRRLNSSPIPLGLVSEFRQFTRRERLERQVLKLTSGPAIVAKRGPVK
jgi:superfamily II DNA or RNA helicase